MIQRYLYSTRWEKNVVAIIHIYGARSIFLLFYDNQATESESCEIEMIISQPISTQTIYQRIYGTMMSIMYNMVEKYCDSYSYLWDFSHCFTTLWLPRHWIWVMRNGNWCRWTNINTDKNPNALWYKFIHTPQDGSK